MQLPTVKDLFNAGAHFGHQKANSHPKAKHMIFSIVKGVYIINLDETRIQIEKAAAYLKNQAAANKTFLFVGTKRQAKERIEKICSELNLPYITNKWLGGTLTNFETIKLNLKKMVTLEDEMNDPVFATKSKKYQSVIKTHAARLHRDLDGIKDLEKVPDVLIIIDTNEEKTAVTEARRLKIPVVGLADTNADPTAVKFPIVVNDDSFQTVDLVLNTLAASIVEGRKGLKVETPEVAKPTEDEAKIEAPKEIKKETKIKTKNTK